MRRLVAGTIFILGLVVGSLAFAEPPVAEPEGSHEETGIHDAMDASEAGAHGGVDHGEGAHAAGHGGEELNVADFSYKDEHKNPPLILALINFGILLALLGWKMVPALREYWAAKSNTIRDGLEEGKRLREQAEAKLEEYGQRIKDVDAEVEALIKDIRAEAEAEKERILADARAQAEATKRAADERIAAELAAARVAIEREVVEKAIEAAHGLLRDKVSAADQQQLVGGFITSLSQSPARTTRGSTPE